MCNHPYAPRRSPHSSAGHAGFVAEPAVKILGARSRETASFRACLSRTGRGNGSMMPKVMFVGS